MDEEPEQRHAEPAVDPVQGTLPVMRQEAAAAEREIRAGETRARVAHVAAERQLQEKRGKTGQRQPLEPPRHRSMHRRALGEDDEAGENQERVHEVGGAHEPGQLEEHGHAAQADLCREEGDQDEAQAPWRSGRRAPPGQDHGHEQQQGERDGFEPMAEFDQDLSLRGRQQAPVAEGPVGAAEARAGGAHDIAHGHEEEEGDDGRPRPAARWATGHARPPRAPP